MTTMMEDGKIKLIAKTKSQGKDFFFFFFLLHSSSRAGKENGSSANRNLAGVFLTRLFIHAFGKKNSYCCT